MVTPELTGTYACSDLGVENFDDDDEAIKRQHPVSVPEAADYGEVFLGYSGSPSDDASQDFLF